MPSPPCADAAPRLLDRGREVIHIKHYSIRTEQAYLHWIRRYILSTAGICRSHPSGDRQVEIDWRRRPWLFSVPRWQKQVLVPPGAAAFDDSAKGTRMNQDFPGAVPEIPVHSVVKAAAYYVNSRFPQGLGRRGWRDWSSFQRKLQNLVDQPRLSRTVRNSWWASGDLAQSRQQEGGR